MEGRKAAASCLDLLSIEGGMGSGPLQSNYRVAKENPTGSYL